MPSFIAVYVLTLKLSSCKFGTYPSIGSSTLLVVHHHAVAIKQQLEKTHFIEPRRTMTSMLVVWPLQHCWQKRPTRVNMPWPPAVPCAKENVHGARHFIAIRTTAYSTIVILQYRVNHNWNESKRSKNQEKGKERRQKENESVSSYLQQAKIMLVTIWTILFPTYLSHFSPLYHSEHSHNPFISSCGTYETSTSL